MQLFKKLQKKYIFYKLKNTNYVNSLEMPIKKVTNHNPFLHTFEGDDPGLIMKQMESIVDDLLNVLSTSDRVFIKINTNSSFPYPASTSVQFLDVFLSFLKRINITRLTVGDCSSNRFMPTRHVYKALGINKVVKGKAELIALEEGPYVNVELQGKYLKRARISAHAYSYDKIINLTNMKTHYLAAYSLAMKNLVGFLHPLDRKAFHGDHLQEKIAELSLAIVPDLNIIDARNYFITGGPDEGEVAQGNMVLVSNDILSIDTEAYKQLYQWKREAGIIGEFQEDPACMTQISHYMEIHNRREGRNDGI